MSTPAARRQHSRIVTRYQSDLTDTEWARDCAARELVISGRDTPALLDLVGEPFDQIPRAIQIRAKADRVFAISVRRNARPCSLLAGKLPDPSAS
jgi:hypothetical protein